MLSFLLIHVICRLIILLWKRAGPFKHVNGPDFSFLCFGWDGSSCATSLAPIKTACSSCHTLILFLFFFLWKSFTWHFHFINSVFGWLFVVTNISFLIKTIWGFFFLNLLNNLSLNKTNYQKLEWVTGSSWILNEAAYRITVSLLMLCLCYHEFSQFKVLLHLYFGWYRVDFVCGQFVSGAPLGH